ncbi:diguanylate cyclase [Thermus brockianus]
MVPYGLGLLALLLFLGLFPPTAPWSERLLTPLVALGAGGYLLWRRAFPWGLGLLFWGLGDLGWTLGDLFARERSLGALAFEFPYIFGYGAFTWAILQVPGHPPRLTLLLLPVGAFGLATLWQGDLGVDRLYTAWDTVLLLLLLPRLEPLFQERFLGSRTLWGVGFLLVFMADLAYAYLEAQGGYPTGHPVHLLWALGYLLLALGVAAENQGSASFSTQAVALGGVFLLPATLLAEPTPWPIRILSLYAGLVGALGLLYAQHREWRRTEEERLRWTRFLEELARLSPSVTQTLSPEAALLGALGAAQVLLPQAVGLEVRSRRGLVGERTPHILPVPLNGDAAYLYLREPLKENVPPSFLSLLGERLRQVLKQVEWGTLALTDPLTGLLNRRGLEAELPKLLALSGRYQAPVSVVMLDIDRFKRVNDTFGHPVGDEVLKRLGRILQASVRREDLAVRYGGEEFLLLLYGANRQAAKEVVERIRARFRTERVEPIPYALTLSAGIAGGEVPAGDGQLEEWILKADYALLRAKEAGRDRVTLA